MVSTSFPPLPEGLNADKLPDGASRLNSSTIHFTRYLRALRHGDNLTLDRRSPLSLLVFGGPQRTSAIARRELISLPAASRMVASLNALGLVERRSDPSDGRSVVISATAAGRALMGVATGERVSALAWRLAGLMDDELEALSCAADLIQALALEGVDPTRQE